MSDGALTQDVTDMRNSLVVMFREPQVYLCTSRTIGSYNAILQLFWVVFRFKRSVIQSTDPETQCESGDEGRSLLEVGSQEVNKPAEQRTKSRRFAHALCVLGIKGVLELRGSSCPVNTDDGMRAQVLWTNVYHARSGGEEQEMVVTPQRDIPEVVRIYHRRYKQVR